ncbi:hypothetical protein ACX0HA_13760 [Flavobacterium hauense]
METLSLPHKGRAKEFKATLHPEISKEITHVNFEEVERLGFESRISLKAVLWAVAFFIFFLDIYVTSTTNDWFLSGAAILSVCFCILSLILIDRKFFIILYMNDGSRTKIEVAKDNKVAAEEFVALVSERI